MIATATWQDVLKENLVGRVMLTREMGVRFRGTIDRVEVKDNILYIYPKIWFRLWPEGWFLWETEKTKALGYPEPLRVPIADEHAPGVYIGKDCEDEGKNGEISFFIPFKGEVRIRYHDCVLQDPDHPSHFNGGMATSELVFLKNENRWAIQTTLMFEEIRDHELINLYVPCCPVCGEKLPQI